MIDVFRIAKFLAANACGIFITPFILTAAIKFGFFPRLPEGENLPYFESWLGGGMWLWIVGGLLSIGCFFVEGKKIGQWLLLAPVYLPLIYSIGILVYMNVNPPAG